MGVGDMVRLTMCAVGTPRWDATSCRESRCTFMSRTKKELECGAVRGGYCADVTLCLAHIPFDSFFCFKIFSILNHHDSSTSMPPFNVTPIPQT